jgi:hypothetical protein
MQVLIGYSSVKDNAILSMSLVELKDKANQILTDMNNSSHQELGKSMDMGYPYGSWVWVCMDVGQG